MVNAQNIAHQPVKASDGENALQQSDEMMGEGYPWHEHLEFGVALDGTYDLLCHVVGLEQREYL